MFHGALGAVLLGLDPQAYRCLFEKEVPPWRLVVREHPVWTLALVLLGDACAFAGSIIVATRKMLHKGLGRQRLAFGLISVEQDVGREERRPLSQGCGLQNLPQPVRLGQLIGRRTTASDVMVRFSTPVFMKSDGSPLRTAPDYATLVRRAVERAGRFMALANEIPELPGGWVEQARAVRLVSARLAWAEFERYSARQRRSMPIGGLLGTLEYSGPAGSTLDWLDACVWLGLGGKNTFGLGGIEISAH